MEPRINLKEWRELIDKILEHPRMYLGNRMSLDKFQCLLLGYRMYAINHGYEMEDDEREFNFYVQKKYDNYVFPWHMLIDLYSTTYEDSFDQLKKLIYEFRENEG